MLLKLKTKMYQKWVLLVSGTINQNKIKINQPIIIINEKSLKTPI